MLFRRGDFSVTCSTLKTAKEPFETWLSRDSLAREFYFFVRENSEAG